MSGATGGKLVRHVSVVVPTYNGAASLPELLARLATTLDALGLQWELILVDDASPDRTPQSAAAVAADYPQLRYVRLERNGGQHAATIAGLRLAVGEVMVTLDDDLQQPPESIPRLIAALDAGAEVAIGRFPNPAHPLWRRVGSRLVHRLVSRRGQGGRLSITSFKAFRRAAALRLVDAIPATGPFYISVILQSVIPRSDIVNVDVPHHPRRHGRSGYGAMALLRLSSRALLTRLRRTGA